MTIEQITKTLKDAGLPAWAITDTLGMNEEKGLSVHFEELEKFCDNDAAAEKINGLNPEVTDKGLYFAATA